LATFLVIASPSNSSCSEERIVVETTISCRIAEIDKDVEFQINTKQFRSAPAWNGVDFDSLPVSMERAVRAARKFLTDSGCSTKNYFLYECSLNRLDKIEISKRWYWSIIFADTTVVPASSHPEITIPVLLDGTVPKATFTAVK
jgi:hypothetical protein